MDSGISRLTVACVLSDPIRTDHQGYRPEHVERMLEMITDHVEQPFVFECVDDSPYPGWWAKISLFEPGRFSGRVLYLDLDVTVVGQIDPVARIEAPFAAIKDYQNPMTINSSVMVWDAGTADHVFSEFSPEVMERFRGDQDWINNRMPSARRFPKEWCVSYKATVKPMGRVPDGARIVVYHGLPKPWDLAEDHLGDY